MDNGNTKAANLWVNPGHFYSPIPSLIEIQKHENRIFDRTIKAIPGIDLNIEQQLRLLEKFGSYYIDLPFDKQKKDDLRYYFENPAYSYSDAICLYSMIREFGPKKIIEIGSGYSSCVMLDTNELFFQNQIDCTFIEPYPDLLRSLINEDDKTRCHFIESNLQDVPLSEFAKLEANDILFIDSTHVAKTGSDVNYIIFNILPLLEHGVYIHFHDIFWPFEYPKEWIYEGRAWNEDYFLHAFLMYNYQFEIVFLNTYLEEFYEDRFMKNMPLCLKNRGGSIWLRKKCG